MKGRGHNKPHLSTYCLGPGIRPFNYSTELGESQCRLATLKLYCEDLGLGFENPLERCIGGSIIHIEATCRSTLRCNLAIVASMVASQGKNKNMQRRVFQDKLLPGP